jgi:uncharacterized RDD family membrane protein YckC
MKDSVIALEQSPQLAPIIKRWLASGVDYTIYIGMTIAIGYAFRGGVNIHSFTPAVRYLVLLAFYISFLTPWLLVLPGIETLNNGQTIGKALFRIKAIRQNGSKINFSTSIVRHLLGAIDYFPAIGLIGVLVAASNKNKQRLGDMVAKTIVVDVQK